MSALHERESVLMSLQAPGDPDLTSYDLLMSLLRISISLPRFRFYLADSAEQLRDMLDVQQVGVVECRNRHTVTVWVTGPVLLVSRLKAPPVF